MEKARVKKVRKFLKDMQSRMIQREDKGVKFNVKDIAKQHGLSTTVFGSANAIGFSIDCVVTDQMAAETINYDNERRNVRRRERKMRKDHEAEMIRKDLYYTKERIVKLQNNLETSKVALLKCQESHDACKQKLKGKINRATLVQNNNKLNNKISDLTRRNYSLAKEVNNMRERNDTLKDLNNKSGRKIEGLNELLKDEYNISAQYRKLNEELHESVALHKKNADLSEAKFKARLKLKWWQLIFND